MERVQFYSADCKLNGYLFIPHSHASPHRVPCVCIVPGADGLVFPTGRENDSEVESKWTLNTALPNLSGALQSVGFLVFTYDGRGSGGFHPEFPKSEGKRTEQRVTREDLAAALDFIETLDEVDTNRIGAFGESVGGAAVAFQAAEDNRLKSIALWGTPSSYTDCVIKGTLKLDRTGIDPKSNLLDMEHVLHRIKQPVLLAGGSRDEVFFDPATQQKNLQGLCASSTVATLVVRDFGHCLDSHNSSFSILIDLLTSWFKSTL